MILIKNGKAFIIMRSKKLITALLTGAMICAFSFTALANGSWQLDASGAWVLDGTVQQRASIPEIDEIAMAQIGDGAAGEGAVTDGKSVAQITLNSELADLIRKSGSIDNFPDRTQIASYVNNENFPRYSINYRRNEFKITITADGEIREYVGRVDQILNNVPSQGISLDAFYENTGFDMRYDASPSTGISDQVFNLPFGTYRMTQASAGDRSGGLFAYNRIFIVLTQGTDGNWYIYPDSQIQIN